MIKKQNIYKKLIKYLSNFLNTKFITLILLLDLYF